MPYNPLNLLTRANTWLQSQTAPSWIATLGWQGSPATGDWGYDTTSKTFKSQEALGTKWNTGMYYVNSAPATAITAAAKTAFSTQPTAFPAASLATGKRIHVKVGGVYTTNNATPGTDVFTLELGGVAVITSAAQTLVNSLTNNPWEFEGDILIQTYGASGASQIEASGHLIIGGITIPVTAICGTASVTTVDLTSSCTLILYNTFTATGHSITARTFIVDVS